MQNGAAAMGTNLEFLEQLRYDPGIPFWGICPKESKSGPRGGTGSPVFTAAPSTLAQDVETTQVSVGR